jgi:hypothetical protein
LDDPVVDLLGLERISELKILRFFHVPQIDSYAFLGGLHGLEVIEVSFGRVKDVEFLKKLPALRVFALEFCDDWETGGLPFLREPLDLHWNPRLEYHGFRVCGLSELPEFKNLPESMKVLDLSYNQLEISAAALAAHPSISLVPEVYVEGNKIAEAGLPGYISTKSPVSILEGYLR